MVESAWTDTTARRTEVGDILVLPAKRTGWFYDILPLWGDRARIVFTNGIDVRDAW